MENVHHAMGTIQKTRGFFLESAASVAAEPANRASKSAKFDRHRAPTLQTGNSKFAAQNSRSPRPRFHALRRTPPPNIPAECCQNRHASAPGPRKTNDGLR